MKKNMGKLDAIIRLVAALLVAILFITGAVAITSGLGMVLAIFAIIFVVTGFVNFAPCTLCLVLILANRSNAHC